MMFKFKFEYCSKGRKVGGNASSWLTSGIAITHINQIHYCMLSWYRPLWVHLPWYSVCHADDLSLAQSVVTLSLPVLRTVQSAGI